MKRFSTILRHLGDQKKNIVLYFVCILLAVIFSLVSLAGIAPFLQMLFADDLVRPTTEPELSFSASSVAQYLEYQLSRLIFEHDKATALAVVCIFVIVSILIKNVFIYLSYRVMAPIRNHVMTNLRAGLYGKILQLPIGYFTEKRKGDIISRMSNDMNEIEWSIIGTLEGLIREPISILVFLGTLIFLSPSLTLVVLILLPIAGFIIGRLSKSLRKDSGTAQQELGTLMSIVDETLGGLRVIKAFNAERMIGDKFYSSNNWLNSLRNRIAFRRDMASPMSEVLGVIVLCIILYYGGSRVLSDPNQLELTANTFITYILVFSQIINPAKSLSTAFYNTQRGSAAIERIEEVLKAPITVQELPDAKTLSSFNDKIEFRNVSFSYEDVVILDNINLVVEKGKTIALVGSSGAGKSTLADLIPRFHDVTTGELLIDGVNIKEYSLGSLRHHMGIVTQEPVLFNDTIASNISLGDNTANIAEIEDAATIANAHDFIMNKEEGYQTNIGDRGTKLSGGERQRVTIARAVLKNPPILILDEATSSLDTESERLVQDAISKMMQNRTSIVIAHRLSTIRHADEIIVLQKGRIIERGTHAELILLNSFYKKLVDMQEIS
ncbi:MAG: ABC transporter ATP-binding protein [Chitinophagaceae bacterium]|nr:ABC transporter ATP-binding protein [Chitinophagaceae bacterium]